MQGTETVWLSRQVSHRLGKNDRRFFWPRIAFCRWIDKKGPRHCKLTNEAPWEKCVADGQAWG